MFLFVKLCGRAGRGGNKARAHIIFNKKQNVNPEVKEFCESKENCRRQQMLRCVRSERVDSTSNYLCCDTCSGVGSIPDNLKFQSFTGPVPVCDKVQPQKRCCVSKLSKELTEQRVSC